MNVFLSYHRKILYKRTTTCKGTSDAPEYNHHPIRFAESEARGCQRQADNTILCGQSGRRRMSKARLELLISGAIVVNGMGAPGDT